MTTKTTPKRTWKHFPVGTKVAHKDAELFGGDMHFGVVVSVEWLPNGYPQTFADFPTKGGVREWNVDNLKTPDQFQDFPNFWVC